MKSIRLTLRTLFALLFVFLYAGCEHVDNNEDVGCNTPYVASDYPASTVSFQNDILPILANNSCSSGFCHGNTDSPPSNFLVLDAVSIMGPGNRASAEDACDVVRGNPDESFIIRMLEGTVAGAPRMPMGGDPISDADMNTIRQWITEGAPDN